MYVGLKRVQRLMRELSIHSIIQAKYRPTTNTDPVESKPNLLQQDFTTTTVNQKWVADITYIHTDKEGWTYLASVMDLYTRKIIGYCYAKNMTAEIVIESFKRAIEKQKPNAPVIVQTDLGKQYTSNNVELFLETNGILHSYSRKGTPYDKSAAIESFHATLKKEELYRNHHKNFNEARLALLQYIEGWYNRKRIHGAIAYLTPQEAEEQARNVS